MTVYLLSCADADVVMLPSRLMDTFRFSAPAVLALKLATRTPLGRLATYSRLDFFGVSYLLKSCEGGMVTYKYSTPPYVYDTPVVPSLVSSQRT